MRQLVRRRPHRKGHWSEEDRRGKVRLRRFTHGGNAPKSAKCNQHGPLLPGARVNQQAGAEAVPHGVGFVVRLVEWFDHGPDGGGSGADNFLQPIFLTRLEAVGGRRKL